MLANSLFKSDSAVKQKVVNKPIKRKEESNNLVLDQNFHINFSSLVSAMFAQSNSLVKVLKSIKTSLVFISFLMCVELLVIALMLI